VSIVAVAEIDVFAFADRAMEGWVVVTIRAIDVYVPAGTVAPTVFPFNADVVKKLTPVRCHLNDNDVVTQHSMRSLLLWSRNHARKQKERKLESESD